MQILKKYPPSLGRILKLDPGLMQNDAYMAPYKDLATYLAQHPEVHRNPDLLPRADRGATTAATTGRNLGGSGKTS